MTQLIQPQEDQLPARIKQNVEKAKNLVTLHEAEAKRFKALAVSEQYTVDQLVKQKIELKEQIKELEETLNSLKVEAKKVTYSVADKTKELAKLSEELASIKAEREKLEVSKRGLEDEQEELKAQSFKKEEDLKIRTAEVVLREESVKEKIELLKDVASKL